MTESWETGQPGGVSEDLSLAEHQNGFRKVHSTTTGLIVVKAQITRDHNQKLPLERNILVVLLLLKPFFYTVNHTTLLQYIEQSPRSPGLKRWTMNYQSGRQSSVLFRSQN